MQEAPNDISLQRSAIQVSPALIAPFAGASSSDIGGSTHRGPPHCVKLTSQAELKALADPGSPAAVHDFALLKCRVSKRQFAAAAPLFPGPLPQLPGDFAGNNVSLLILDLPCVLLNCVGGGELDKCCDLAQESAIRTNRPARTKLCFTAAAARSVSCLFFLGLMLV